MYISEVKTKILVECQELLASVKIGVLEPLRPLLDKQCVEIRFKRTLDVNEKDISWCDILITVRAVEYASLKIIAKAKELKRYIIYFLDDDFLGLPSDLPGCEIFDDIKIKKNMISILEQSDILWCVNQLIGEKYGTYTKSGYIIGKVPINVSFEAKKRKDNIVKILYAGSDSHTPLIEKHLKPLAIKLSKKYNERIEITFLGARPKIDINLYKNIKIIKPFEDYTEYRNFVESEGFDIGLAIIGEEDFYRFKYYNKFIEYTSVGCVGVYTDSEPYTLIVKDFENGLLTSNTVDDWYNRVSLLIENEQLRKKCLENAIELLFQKFNYEEVSEELKNAIPELISYRAPYIEFQNVKLPNLKFIFIRERLFYLFRRYKFAAVLIISQKIVKKFYRNIKL